MFLSKCNDLDSFQDEEEQSCKGNEYWLLLPVLELHLQIPSNNVLSITQVVVVILITQRENKRKQTSIMQKSIEPNILLRESAICRHFLEVLLLTSFR